MKKTIVRQIKKGFQSSRSLKALCRAKRDIAQSCFTPTSAQTRRAHFSSASPQITSVAAAGKHTVGCYVRNKSIETFFPSRLNDYANLIRNAVLTTMNETRVSEARLRLLYLPVLTVTRPIEVAGETLPRWPHNTLTHRQYGFLSFPLFFFFSYST